jgi:hypothetical protein
VAASRGTTRLRRKNQTGSGSGLEPGHGNKLKWFERASSAAYNRVCDREMSHIRFKE